MTVVGVRLPLYRDFAPRIGLAYSPNLRQDLLVGKIVGGPGRTSTPIEFCPRNMSAKLHLSARLNCPR
jgi:hypothetical protein